MRKFALVIGLLMLLPLGSLVAQDSVTVVRDNSITKGQIDTIRIKSYAARYDPRKAIFYAAIVPGLGQVYTKKYWKLPLVYGGFIGIGYGFNFYQKGYTDFKAQLYYNLENGLSGPNQFNPDSQFTTQQIRIIIDRYREQRDLMIILFAGMYILQIVDAHVDTHLKEFDLNPNLKVSIEPMMSNDMLVGRQTGVSLILRF